MDIILKVTKGSKVGAKVAIKKDEFIIGRSPECNLCAASTSISRKHCVIKRSGTTVTVADLGSRNGTLINGEKIPAETELTSGDTLTIGNLEFLVTLTTGINNQKKPQVKSVAEAAERTAKQAHGSDIKDDDISKWLLEGTPPGKEVTDTLTIQLDETAANELRDAINQIRAKTGDVLDAETADLTEAQAAADAQAEHQDDHQDGHDENKKDKKKEPGKLPPIPHKPGSKDSREAAMEAPKSWSRRR